jgi:hypothetical protein
MSKILKIIFWLTFVSIGAIFFAWHYPEIRSNIQPSEDEIANQDVYSNKDFEVMIKIGLIQIAAQIFYDENGSYLNFDKDPDISNLGKEIQEKTESVLRFLSSDEAYCLYTVLSDDKTYYCIDSKGEVGENLICDESQLKCVNR